MRKLCVPLFSTLSCGLIGCAVLIAGCSESEAEPVHQAIKPEPTGPRISESLAVYVPTQPEKPLTSVVSASTFVEVRRQAGIEYQYSNGAAGAALMVEAAGGGAGWIDFDNDGLWDLYLVQAGNPVATTPTERPANCLYRNLGDGTFVELAGLSRTDDRGYGYGVAIADFDNDGFDDIYLTNVGHNVLYHNQGDGTFQDITKAAQADDQRWSSSAAWGDLDRDGDLDLFVCSYTKYDPLHPLNCKKDDGTPTMCHPNQLDAEPNACFSNMGNGTFRRVEHSWNLRGAEKESKSLGVVIADFNDDGNPDVFIANDTTANYYFINQGNRRFKECAMTHGCALCGLGTYQAGMGVAVGDYDRNGLLDVYLTHFVQESNTLYANHGETGFIDQTRASGLHQPTLSSLGFGTIMADFNHDGYEEIFITNGHIDDWREVGDRFKMPAQLFSFNGNQWQECGQSAGQYFKQNWIGRGVASCDFDDDGDLDLAIVHQNAPMALLRNDSHAGHWLKVRLIGRESNRWGTGAKVTLRQNGRVLVQQLVGGSSYCASNEPILIFGLGDYRDRCELEIRWPSGIVQIASEVDIDQSLVYLERVN